MTVMAGATIAPALPGLKAAFETVPQVDLLVKLVLTLPALLIALFAPVSGWVIDRFGRKRLLIGSLLLYALTGPSGYYLDHNLYVILAGRALLGVAVAGVMTTATTLVGDYFEGEARSSFLGTQAAFMALGGAVFVTLGGYLADLDWRYPFLIYLSAALLAPVAWWVLDEPARGDVKEGIAARAAATYDRSQVALVYGLAFIGMVVFYIIPVQVPFLLQAFEGVNGVMTGVAISGATLMAALASGNFRRVRQRLTPLQVFAVAFLLMGAGCLVISQAPSYWPVAGGLLVSGLGAGLLLPNANLWIVTLAPTVLRGRLVGGVTMAIFLGQFFSPILIDPIRQWTSLPVAFALVALVLALLGSGLGSWSLLRTETDT
jgi:MFS family permease